MKQHFDCYSWAFLSQQFSTKDVMVGILMGVASSDDKTKLERTEEERVPKFMLERMKQ